MEIQIIGKIKTDLEKILISFFLFIFEFFCSAFSCSEYTSALPEF